MNELTLNIAFAVWFLFKKQAQINEVLIQINSSCIHIGTPIALGI